MNLPPPTAKITLQSHPAGSAAWVNHLNFSIRVLLCMLLFWVAFQGFQRAPTALASPPIATVECFGACGLDAILDAEVIVSTDTSQVSCSGDDLWPCEPDHNDLDMLHDSGQSLAVTVLKPSFTPLVPTHEFQLSPLLKPPRYLA